MFESKVLVGEHLAIDGRDSGVGHVDLAVFEGLSESTARTRPDIAGVSG